MRIIALEGIDKSGKETQTRLLATRLKERGFKVMTGDFPRYETQVGHMIKQALYGEIPVTPEQFAKLYEIDRFHAQPLFQEHERNAVDFLVLDRYTMSNMVFQRAKGFSPIDILAMQNGLRHADLHIVVDIPVEESLRRGQAYEKLDNNEKNVVLLNEVRQLQLEYAETGHYYNTGAVKRVDGNRDINLVSDDIYNNVLAHFCIKEGYKYTF